MEEHPRHEFHEAVVWNCIRKIAGQMPTYIKEVVVLEIGERAEMVADDDGHNLTCSQLSFAVPVAFSIGRGKPFQKIFVHFRIKILAEFINNTKNLCNFILGNHRCLFRNSLFVRLKIIK